MYNPRNVFFLIIKHISRKVKLKRFDKAIFLGDYKNSLPKFLDISLTTFMFFPKYGNVHFFKILNFFQSKSTILF